jgi:hypothetical protein
MNNNMQALDTMQPIVIVSGLPRSGTSMMMMMLEAGGLNVLTDRQRAADINNPRGYYEYERVKQLDKGDTAWLAEAQAKAVKVISALLVYLPPIYPYRVIFMQRNLNEILASQSKMLANRGETMNGVNNKEMAALFTKHIQQTKTWLQTQSAMAILDVDFNEILSDPYSTLEQIKHFLPYTLDLRKMAASIDSNLYRSRH